MLLIPRMNHDMHDSRSLQNMVAVASALQVLERNIAAVTRSLKSESDAVSPMNMSRLVDSERILRYTSTLASWETKRQALNTDMASEGPFRYQARRGQRILRQNADIYGMYAPLSTRTLGRPTWR